MSYKQFLIDHEKNKIYETIAAERICELNNVSVLNTSDNADYDFQTSDNLTYEIKADHLVLKTGNFFIEFYGYGRPSGISISLSNYYILTDTLYFFLIPTDKLKQLVENCEIKHTANGSTSGYIINRYFIVKNSVCI